MCREFLLSDETEISTQDYLERKRLVKEFSALPTEFLSKLRHLQPQIGCLNGCKMCSQFSKEKIFFWSKRRLRNVIYALKHVAKQIRSTKPFVAWDRLEHRVGVVFPYLDNDPGNYVYLDEFVKLVYSELGAVTRISTVGYSRRNEQLNRMHAKIVAKNISALAGVRLSFTPYAAGWIKNPDEYVKDLANFLKIYKPYYESAGSGNRNFCVELRYKPLAVNATVYELTVDGHRVLCTGNYIYISTEKNVTFSEARIANPFEHKITLTQEPIMFWQADLAFCPTSDAQVEVAAQKILSSTAEKITVEVYALKNFDGMYYAINPKLTAQGNYGFTIYPATDKRKISGYLVTERFLLNAMFRHKAKKFFVAEKASWNDVHFVLLDLTEQARHYAAAGKTEKADYIRTELLPMIQGYVTALKEADYDAKVFFDKGFTIDTGTICNLGRAVSEFKGLTQKINEPLTPVHERNYGRHRSTMTQENVAWRLTCGGHDSILVNELHLFEVASERGEFFSTKKISLDEGGDESFSASDLNSLYLIPGQKNF